mmetsp:Transcript_8014/g.18148  ORF Transcript_8014/g.18148 Transcript_8014/m.18148 type:complete len:296 (+) Transcript_8014:246-1133(+)
MRDCASLCLMASRTPFGPPTTHPPLRSSMFAVKVAVPKSASGFSGFAKEESTSLSVHGVLPAALFATLLVVLCTHRNSKSPTSTGAGRPATIGPGKLNATVYPAMQRGGKVDEEDGVGGDDTCIAVTSPSCCCAAAMSWSSIRRMVPPMKIASPDAASSPNPIAKVFDGGSVSSRFTRYCIPSPGVPSGLQASMVPGAQAALRAGLFGEIPDGNPAPAGGNAGGSLVAYVVTPPPELQVTSSSITGAFASRRMRGASRCRITNAMFCAESTGMDPAPRSEHWLGTSQSGIASAPR